MQRKLRGAILVSIASFLLLCIVGWTNTPIPAQNKKLEPEQIKQIQKLNVTAEEMYKLAVAGKILEARSKLNEIAEQIPKIRYEGITSVEGMHSLIQAIVQAKRTFNKVKYDPNEGLTVAATVRLAIDALSHPNQPMWLQYDKVINEELNNFEDAVKKKNVPAMKASYAQLSAYYTRIRPSMMITKTPTDVEKIDSLFAFLNTQLRLTKPQFNMVQNGITEIRSSLNQLFNEKNISAFVPMLDHKNPVLWIFSIGMTVFLFLAYFGWRMFKIDKDRIKSM